MSVGCEQYLNTTGPVYTAEGMCMHTHAALPLPLGHHFLDNEHISALRSCVSSYRTKPEAAPVLV